jgi:predicted AAA+ superfamily ATPase
MLKRPRPLAKLRRGLERMPIVALLGPRQCGKTTLAQVISASGESLYLDLERPQDRRRLESPMQALEGRSGLVVLDEIQRLPELFEILRVLADDARTPARFLILGSAAPELVRGVSETLAGRVTFVDLGGLSADEVGPEVFSELWLRGGFPRSFLATDGEASLEWRQDFTRTFLERDIPALGLSIPAETLRRFWTMLAHSHAELWNASAIGRSLGVNDKTVRRYLDILVGAYMVRALPPWFENLKKRQVKAPKIFLRDSGLLHSLLGIADRDQLLGHPKLGASWEGFVLEHVVDRLGGREAYFWGTHQGAELDLLVFRRGRRLGFEIKFSDAPGLTRSMRIAQQDLGLDSLWVIHPGEASWPMAEGIEAVGFADLLARLDDIQPREG